MRIALIARPQWESDHCAAQSHARLIDAPLQRLQCCEPQPQPFEAFARASSPWVVFTSPASVQAMDLWMAHTGIHPMQLARLRVAAVGSGTRQAIADMALHRPASAAHAWPVSMEHIIVSMSDERADAIELLRALDHQQQREGFSWQEQTLLLAQGENNRPTLADGLIQRGAHVMALAMYRRKDVPWTKAIWQMLTASRSGECGVVVTSSTVVPRLMADLDDHGVHRSHLVWCTQHAAIAEKLRAQGISQIRRVSLSPASLERDLFEHEHYW